MDIMSISPFAQQCYYHSVLSLFLTEWTAYFTCLICGLDNINRWCVNLASIHWCSLLRNTSFYCSSHLIVYHGLLGTFSVFLPVTMIPHCCTCHVKSLWWVGDHVKPCYSHRAYPKWQGFDYDDDSQLWYFLCVLCWVPNDPMVTYLLISDLWVTLYHS
jgi:hypothetical protein